MLLEGRVVPASRTRVFGREEETAAARDRLLFGDRRVLTLVGAGGVGKTTLALEVARAAEAAFPDGVRVVDLTPFGPSDDMATMLVRGLGVSDQGRDPAALLRELLAPRATLLVLDNCEHVAPALEPVLDAVMDACPDLRVLATSRVPLRVRGAAALPVEPMDVPSADVAGPMPLDELARVPGVALFVERATAAAPGFRLREPNVGDVLEVCRRLDGVPLAIELAAALAPTLSPAEIAERLAGREGLRLLEGGVTGRQRTLEAALDWSYDLLDAGAQGLFRRLAVFVGGWTLEAAEAVGALDEAPSAVVPRLATLVAHSLVRREETGESSRYRMLAPVAAYAAARLDASGERAAVARAHAVHMLAATSSASPLGQGRPEDVWRVEVHLDDARAALRAAEAAGMRDVALGLHANLLGYWRVRGMLNEGLQEIERVLVALGPAPSPARAAYLTAQADYLQVSGHLRLALDRAREAESVAVAVGDDIQARAAVALRGIALHALGDLEGSRAAFAEAARLVERRPHDAAVAFLAAAMGELELTCDDLDAAQGQLDRAVEAFGRSPSWFLGRVRANLAVVARRRGDHRAARAHLRDALEWLQAYGATFEAILATDEAAALALDEGDPARAATLLAAATALRDASAIAPTDPQRAAREAAIDRARAGLDARRCRAAWARGRAMSLADVVAFVATAGEPPIRRRRLAHAPELTPREREIAALVAEGLTNPQIAERLLISTGTARIHVERILGKLGFTSRVQIATWYLSEGARAR